MVRINITFPTFNASNTYDVDKATETQYQDNQDVRFLGDGTGNIDDLMDFFNRDTGQTVSHDLMNGDLQRLMNDLANEAKDLWQYGLDNNNFSDILSNINS